MGILTLENLPILPIANCCHLRHSYPPRLHRDWAMISIRQDWAADRPLSLAFGPQQQVGGQIPPRYRGGGHQRSLDIGLRLARGLW